MRPDYGLWQIAKLRNRELMREADQWQLSRHSSQPTWLAQRTRQLLRRLGHWVIRGDRRPHRSDRYQQERLTP